MKADQINYNTTMHFDLIRDLKILSAMLDRRANDLLEEAIQDFFKKYEERLTKLFQSH